MMLRLLVCDDIYLHPRILWTASSFVTGEGGFGPEDSPTSVSAFKGPFDLSSSVFDDEANQRDENRTEDRVLGHFWRFYIFTGDAYHWMSCGSLEKEIVRWPKLPREEGMRSTMARSETWGCGNHREGGVEKIG
ncbi:hypothetical protein Acr_00g0022260 [Actinidia rufa]|uniref:Uncharacterized protein n=1 Tax=Actinidia rufa TaxID=165716 RepID=A0A7J0DCJ0_9ERIC|nr:hypothetical protein Acr_00g0022260 [Actinidia rufa]